MTLAPIGGLLLSLWSASKSWGAVAATLLWIAGSAAFSVYVRNFGSYSETCGSIGAIIILLT